VVNRRKNGLLYTEHLSITAIRDERGECLHYVAVFSDITQRKQAEERLHFLANHDALTGLPNRTLFIEKLQSAVEQARQYDRRFALLFIDLDRFKMVNDTLGHHAGDELLVRIASELQRIVPNLSTVSGCLATNSPCCWKTSSPCSRWPAGRRAFWMPSRQNPPWPGRACSSRPASASACSRKTAAWPMPCW
jgi:hypothetical protein